MPSDWRAMLGDEIRFFDVLGSDYDYRRSS